MKLDSTWLLAGAGAVPVAAVGTALFTQHVLGMQPCPWCVLQRLIFLSISLMALLALALRSDLPRRLFTLLMLALAGCGISAALWQHFVAARHASCAQTLADRVVNGLGLDEALPQVFAPYASCADAAATLLGVPYEFYSLTLFVMLAITSVWVLWRPAMAVR